MNRGINLLGEKKQSALTPTNKKLRTLRFAAIILLFIVPTISIILFLLIALSPLPSLQKQEQNALSTISKQHPDMAKLQLVDERLKTTNVILTKRRNFDQIFEAVKSQMPNGLSMTTLSIKDKDISVTVTSGSLSSLDTFLNNLASSADKKESFASATLTGLVTNQQQNTFTLTVSLVAL